jgi:hypothetical protein
LDKNNFLWKKQLKEVLRVWGVSFNTFVAKNLRPQFKVRSHFGLRTFAINSYIIGLRFQTITLPSWSWKKNVTGYFIECLFRNRLILIYILAFGESVKCFGTKVAWIILSSLLLFLILIPSSFGAVTYFLGRTLTLHISIPFQIHLIQATTTRVLPVKLQ